MRFFLLVLFVTLPCSAETLLNLDFSSNLPVQSSQERVEPSREITVLTQVKWNTQFLAPQTGVPVSFPQKNSWIFPGLPQFQMGEKVKGTFLSGGFLLSGIGSIVALSIANNAYQDSQTIWKDAMEQIDLDQRAETVKRSYDAYDLYNSTLMMAGCLGVSAITIWVYSALDSRETVKLLKRSGIELHSRSMSITFGFSI